MERLYAIINPLTNKIVQFSQLENLDFKCSNVEYVDGKRVTTEVIALCIPVVYTSDLVNKTYDPVTGTFN